MGPKYGIVDSAMKSGLVSLIEYAFKKFWTARKFQSSKAKMRIIHFLFALFKLPVEFQIHCYPVRGLAVNFRKKWGEMRWKKLNFTAYFLHLFAVNAVNCGELFIFPAFCNITKNCLYTGANLSPPSCRQLSLASLIFFVNLNQIE